MRKRCSTKVPRTEIRQSAFVLVILVAAFALVSCEQSSPEILDTDYRIRFHYDWESGAVDQQLALHVAVESREAAEEISSMNIFPELSELSWSISSEKLIVTETGDRVWLGSNAIEGPRYLPRGAQAVFPEGTYRVEIINSRGEVASADFLMPRSELYNELLARKESRFPSIKTVTQTNGQLAVSLTYRNNVLVLGFSEEGQLLRGFRPTSPMILPGMEEYAFLKEFSYVELVTIDPLTDAELVSGPFHLNFR